MIFLITYDLNKPAQEYPKLYEAIMNLGAWWHHLDSTWVVNTTLKAQDVFNQLKQCIDQNDRLLIINITNQERQGWLPPEAWQWLIDAETE